ncbi:MAG: thiolase family protein [Gemmatimonadota bacterium]
MTAGGGNNDIVFLSGRRTPFGSFGGSLKGLTATELGVAAALAALEGAGVDRADVGHVIFGNALQTSADAIYLARHVGLGAGLPEVTPAVTVNRLCGSGFQAITQAAQEILTGDARVVLAGGTESMSQAPHVLRGARWGELRFGDASSGLEDALWEALVDGRCGMSMAQTAEELARRYEVTREEADEAAFQSHARAQAAWEAGRFAAEVAPVEVVSRRESRTFSRDEHIREDATPEGFARLPPAFEKEGLVTAGNASGIGDGAVATVLASGAWSRERGLRPLGRLVSWAYVGVDPRIMGIGPVPAARKALSRAGLSLDAMDLVEVNEAFAPQYVAVCRELGLDPSRTNVNGGAIALTHPLAASGARITVHLLHELRRRGGRYALGSACIGGGQGAGVVIEAFPD